MTFWNWGPTTIWHNIPSVAFLFQNHSTLPYTHCAPFPGKSSGCASGVYNDSAVWCTPQSLTQRYDTPPEPDSLTGCTPQRFLKNLIYRKIFSQFQKYLACLSGVRWVWILTNNWGQTSCDILVLSFIGLTLPTRHFTHVLYLRVRLFLRMSYFCTDNLANFIQESSVFHMSVAKN